MERLIFQALMITSAFCLSAKYVFIQTELPWYKARLYCEDHYNGFSHLVSEEVEKLFRRSVGEDKEGWIGIYWDKNMQRWKWSGGDIVTYHNGLDLPNNNDPANLQHTGDNVFWTKDGWKWKNGEEQHSFFCLRLIVVQEEKTWEEALEHCRKTQLDLTSVLSETENLLTANMTNQTSVTEQVWMGLRYLGDSWLWVNGDPLEYTAWSQGDREHQCPMKGSCGAVSKEGVWESRDCQQKLHFVCS